MALASAQLGPLGPGPIGPGPVGPAPHHVPHHKPIHHDHAPPVYNYAYAVEDPHPGYGGPVKFGHTETRDGYNTQGEYHVLLPDGRVQTVTYHVDGEYGGYVADVSENSVGSKKSPFFNAFYPFQVKYAGTPHYGPAPHHDKPHHAPKYAPPPHL